MIHNEECCEFYLDEDRRSNTKESFQLLFYCIQKYKSDWKSLCDVGCATGDFLWYVNKMVQEQNRASIKLTGIDTYDALRETASRRVPAGEFIKGDIYSMEGIDSHYKYDVVCMSGVLSMLDDFHTPIKNLISITNKGGKVFIYSVFNDNKCAVEVRYVIDKKEKGRLMITSKQELGEWLSENGYEYEFIPFKMKGEIKQREDQPLRSFTVPLADGTNGLMNGLGVWHDFYLLMINV